jgi:VanZ family protein
MNPDSSARSAGYTFVSHWLPVIGLCTLIFIQSAFASSEQIPRWPYLDKLLHLTAYGILGALVCRASNTIESIHLRGPRLFLIGVLVTTLYGLSDEWHQSFVPGRSAVVADLLADFVGAVLGCAIWIKAALSSRKHE